MYHLFVKTAFRNLQRNKRHALLNIIGLAVAIAACIIVFLVIQHETSYNKYLRNYDSLFQVITNERGEAGDSYTQAVPFPALKALRKDYPEYQFGVMHQEYGIQATVKDDNNGTTPRKFLEPLPGYFMDSTVMKLLELHFIAGSAEALNDLQHIGISRQNAIKYFGSWEQAIGKRVNLNNQDQDLIVGAVFENIPATSDFPMDIIANYATWEAMNSAGWPLEDWGALSSNHQVFVLLPEKVSGESFNKQLATFYTNNIPSNEKTNKVALVRPFSSIHFDESTGNNGDHVTSKSSLLTLGFIGLLIILMACINFVNLATALAATRSKEIGVRKVMGGSTGQIRRQVLLETTFVVLFSLLVAILLAYIALPYVKHIMVVQSDLDLFNRGSIIFLSAITIFTILFSGLYPSIVLGSFTPGTALKNTISNSKVGHINLRRLLVVVQFASSQILIVATIISIAQMNYVHNADMGFNKESLLMLGINSDSTSLTRMPAFKQELLSRSDVQAVSYSFDPPSSTNSWNSNFAIDNTEDKPYTVNLKFGDEDYFKTYGMQIIAGRSYRLSDTTREYVVNETFVKKAGLADPEDAIGKMVRLGGGKFYPITGVVKDFKNQSLKNEIPPIIITPRSQYYGVAGVKLASNNLMATRQQIEQLWNKYFPEYVYNANFYDEEIENYYQQDTRLQKMYSWYAILAILISCLGLYGLVSFMVVQKTKEVGIRKVLGASVSHIVYLFSKEFTILIVIAFVVAAPVAWLLMQKWLNDFAYRITPGPMVFVAAILISILMAWIAVGYKSVRAGLANPIRSLRTE